MVDVFVRTCKLPDKVQAFTMPGYDGMNVYISEDLDEAHRLAAYEHELRHIERKDFEKENVQEIETCTHEREDMQ